MDWLEGQFDLFYFFRTVLFLFLGTYTVLLTVGSIGRLIGLLAGDGREKEMLRVYVAYQLLTIRVRPLMGELVQILLLVMALALLWWLHALV